MSQLLKILYGVGVSSYSSIRIMLLLKTGGNIQMSEMRVWKNHKDLCLEDSPPDTEVLLFYQYR